MKIQKFTYEQRAGFIPVFLFSKRKRKNFLKKSKKIFF